ncbi:hypothetical protein PCH_Pc13g14040 [Penicillium rubens Wisconsin 54-1255]|uniref:Uncharacterized protein n=1 Tax=Penicillium rubens (strain ATCC 28089 / DSM 1075 / NRRL 1951 / Wisconsin 54-1255) TaxID=500485 RepID=B6H572_PENRW|nr:hypothetical protein PCH_Pc13g14040 [Penicillium rubens Wisconsin 54-1255]
MEDKKSPLYGPLKGIWVVPVDGYCFQSSTAIYIRRPVEGTISRGTVCGGSHAIMHEEKWRNKVKKMTDILRDPPGHFVTLYKYNLAILTNSPIENYLGRFGGPSYPRPSVEQKYEIEQPNLGLAALAARNGQGHWQTIPIWLDKITFAGKRGSGHALINADFDEDRHYIPPEGSRWDVVYPGIPSRIGLFNVLSREYFCRACPTKDCFFQGCNAPLGLPRFQDPWSQQALT